MLQINTQDNSIRFNNQTIDQPYNLKQITAVLGKPDRMETHSRKARYERFGHKSTKRTSTMVDVTDSYHIYDDLGTMFFTSASIVKSGNSKLIIYFKKRQFTNTQNLAFVPNKGFRGVLQINEKTVPADKKLLPKNVDYNTRKFDLWSTAFGPTSTGAVIDRLYSQEAKPYLMFYLDAPKTQRVSYLEVVGKRY